MPDGTIAGPWAAYQAQPAAPPPAAAGAAAQPGQAASGQPSGFDPSAYPAPAAASAPAVPSAGPWTAYANPGVSSGSSGPLADYPAATSVSGASPAPPQAPPGKRSGYAANIAAAGNDLLVGAGLPVDLVTGAINLGSRGINAVAGTDIPPITDPVGGTGWVKRSLDAVGANPDDVVAATPGEALARGVAGGIGAAVIPGLGADAVLESAAARSLSPGARAVLETLRGSGETPVTAAGKNAVVGAMSGAGQTAAQAALPDDAPAWERNVVGLAGAVAGGSLPSLGESAFNAALRRNTVAQTAANKLVGATSDPAALRQSIAGEAADAAEAPNPAANAGTVADYVNRQLASIDQAHGDLVAGAQAHADALREGLGGTEQLPETYGAPAQAAIADRYAPQIAAADQATGAAQTRLQGTLDAMGGTAQPDAQGYGAAMRGVLNDGDKAAGAAEGRLWQAVDPDGTLVMPTGSIPDTARNVLASVNPRMGGTLTAGEEPLLQAAASLNPAEKFGDVQDLYSNLGGAVRSLRTSADPAAPQAIRRLTIVRGAIRQGMAGAAQDVADQEAAQVAAGTLAPADSVAGRLQAYDPQYGQRADEQLAVGGGSNLAPAGRAGSGSAGTGGGYRAERPASGGFGSPAGNPSLARQAGSGAGQKQPPSLLSFLTSKGGVRDPGGDLSAMDAGRARVGFLRKNGGMSLDYAREAAEEAGYLRDSSTTNDLLDAVDQELRGQKVYPQGTAAGGYRDLAGSADAARDAAGLDRARSAVLDAEDAWGGRLSADEVDHATQLVAQGAHPQEAIEDAARSTMERSLDANASRGSYAQVYGVAPDAVQGVAALPGGGNRLVANMDAGASDRIAAARAGTLDRKQTYAQGPVGRVLAPGRQGADYAVAESRVPTTLFSSPEGVQGFLRGVAGQPGGEALARDYLAHDLKRTGVITGSGSASRVDFSRYGKWLADKAPLLRQFPGLLERFSGPVEAQRALDAMQAQRDALGRTFEDAQGSSASTVLDKYLKPGPAGADAMDRFTRETGNSPAAAEAMAQAIAGRLRAVAMKDGVLDPAKYAALEERFRPALSRRPDLLARFGTAAKAQETVTNAIAARNQAVSDYQTGAARFWLRHDPADAIGKALASSKPADALRDMTALVRGDPAAEAGLQRAVLDHVAEATLPNTETGQRFSGTRYANLMRDHRQALAEVLDGRTLARMDAVARALAPSSGHGGKMALLRAVVNNVGSTGLMLAGEHAHGFVGAMVGRGIGEGAEHWFHMQRQANAKHVNDLLVGAYKDPQLAAALVQHATTDKMPALAQRALRRMAQSAAAAAAGMQGGAAPGSP